MGEGRAIVKLGKYELVRKLARGGMAEVFLARVQGPMGFEKALVIKRILPDLVDDPQFVEMFLSEAKLAAQLNHPNIVQMFDFGEIEGAYFIAMEYIEGASLRAIGRQLVSSGERLPLRVVAKIVSQVCEGLIYAHELRDPQGVILQVVHRDISSDNILIGQNGSVKLVDFGIAKAVTQFHHTKAGTVKGKLAYMSPEQIANNPLDCRADIYALGVVLYELVTGAMPFEADNEVALMRIMLTEPMVPIRSRRSDVPEQLVRIIERALKKEREQRYSSCRELQEDLDAFLYECGSIPNSHQIAALVKQAMEGGSPIVRATEAPTRVAPPPRPTEAVTRVERVIPSPPSAQAMTRSERAVPRPEVPRVPGPSASSAPKPPPKPPGRLRPILIASGVGVGALLLLGGAGVVQFASPRTGFAVPVTEPQVALASRQVSPRPDPISAPRPEAGAVGGMTKPPPEGGMRGEVKVEHVSGQPSHPQAVKVAQEVGDAKKLPGGGEPKPRPVVVPGAAKGRLGSPGAAHQPEAAKAVPGKPIRFEVTANGVLFVDGVERTQAAPAWFEVSAGRAHTIKFVCRVCHKERFWVINPDGQVLNLNGQVVESNQLSHTCAQ